MTETDSVVFLRTLALDKNDVDASDFARIADEIEKLRTEVEEYQVTIIGMREQTAWQPIETAPRDGHDILAITQYGQRIVFWDTAREGVWSTWPGRAEVSQPTYWKPLGPPPAEETAG